MKRKADTNHDEDDKDTPSTPHNRRYPSRDHRPTVLDQLMEQEMVSCGRRQERRPPTMSPASTSRGPRRGGGRRGSTRSRPSFHQRQTCQVDELLDVLDQVLEVIDEAESTLQESFFRVDA